MATVFMGFLSLTACVILPAAFWIGAHWRLTGMSLAWLVGAMPEPLMMAALIAAGAVGYIVTALATNRIGVRKVLELFASNPRRARRIERGGSTRTVIARPFRSMR